MEKQNFSDRKEAQILYGADLPGKPPGFFHGSIIKVGDQEGSFVAIQEIAPRKGSVTLMQNSD